MKGQGQTPPQVWGSNGGREKTEEAKVRIERNEPCPCGSGKRYKKCCMSNEAARPSPFAVVDPHPESKAWLAKDGLHVTGPGPGLSPEALEAATKAYQDKLRHSPLWKQMVNEFGEQEAERLLAQCRVEGRDG
jgi:hypothetical protein